MNKQSAKFEFTIAGLDQQRAEWLQAFIVAFVEVCGLIMAGGYIMENDDGEAKDEQD